jgi:hypothetical protein
MELASPAFNHTLAPMPFANSRATRQFFPCTNLGDTYLPLECEYIPSVLLSARHVINEPNNHPNRLPPSQFPARVFWLPFTNCWGRFPCWTLAIGGGVSPACP